MEREADSIARLIELGTVRHDRFCAFDKVGADFGTINKALEPFAVFKQDGVAVLDKQNLFEHVAIIRDGAHPETARVLFRRQDNASVGTEPVHARFTLAFKQLYVPVLGNCLDTRIAGAFHALFSIAPHGIQFLGILEFFIQLAAIGHDTVIVFFRILLGRPTEHARIRRVYPCRQIHLVIVVQDLQGIALDKIQIVEYVFLFRVQVKRHRDELRELDKKFRRAGAAIKFNHAIAILHGDIDCIGFARRCVRVFHNATDQFHVRKRIARLGFGTHVEPEERPRSGNRHRGIFKIVPERQSVHRVHKFLPEVDLAALRADIALVVQRNLRILYIFAVTHFISCRTGLTIRFCYKRIIPGSVQTKHIVYGFNRIEYIRFQILRKDIPFVGTDAPATKTPRCVCRIQFRQRGRLVGFS